MRYRDKSVWYIEGMGSDVDGRRLWIGEEAVES